MAAAKTTQERPSPAADWSIRALAYTEEQNRQPKPFISTAKTNDILEKVKRAKANLNNSQSV
jgi:hypothetical protein